jgi:hypothetical protein
MLLFYNGWPNFWPFSSFYPDLGINMRLLVFIILFCIQTPAYPLGVMCESDGDSDFYRAILEEIEQTPLCSLSPDYVAGFRIVNAHSHGTIQSITVFQRRNGTIDYDGLFPLEDKDYAEIIQEFTSLDIFQLKSYQEILHELCFAPLKILLDKNDQRLVDLTSCPLESDGYTVFIEASYGGKKRTVSRKKAFGAEYVEASFVSTALKLLGIKYTNRNLASQC